MAKIALKKKIQFCGTGRRKSSVARVRLIPGGTGNVIINNREITDYFPLQTLIYIAKQGLELLGVSAKYDMLVSVSGGGMTGQAGAIRHGCARALVLAGENKDALKKAGFLTRDPRMKERKKYGLHAARRAPQFSKR